MAKKSGSSFGNFSRSEVFDPIPSTLLTGNPHGPVGVVVMN